MTTARSLSILLAILLGLVDSLSSQQRAPITQAGRDRARLAASFQQSFREEGCAACRTWVSGPDNTTVKILDPEATTTPNDYNGRPVFWYNAGFTKVIYYSAPGVVYAQHERLLLGSNEC